MPPHGRREAIENSGVEEESVCPDCFAFVLFPVSAWPCSDDLFFHSDDEKSVLQEVRYTVYVMRDGDLFPNSEGPWHFVSKGLACGGSRLV